MSEQGPPGAPLGPHVIWSMDRTGMCTLSTGPGLRHLGVAPAELEGQNLLEVYRDDPHAVASLRRVLAGEQFSTESVFAGRVLSVYYQPLYDDDGTVSGGLGVATDITEQRAAESEARTDRQRLGHLADLSASLSREALDVEALVRLTARWVTGAIGDLGVVRLIGADGVLAVRAVRVADRDLPPDDPAYTECHDTEQRLGTAPSVPDSLVSRLDLDRTLRLPLQARGEVIGAVDIGRAARRPEPSEHEVAFAVEVAERCALALDNALLLGAHRQAREDLVKFRALADASSELIAIGDPDGAVVYMNSRVFEMGIAPAEGDLWTTVEEQAGGPTRQAIRHGLEAEGRWSGDIPLQLLSEGAVVHLDVFTLRHPDSGVPLGSAWIAQDVTGLRTAEHALREADADLMRFKALVEASPDFIAIADLDGTVRYVNPLGRELIGMEPGVDVTATTIADYLTPEGLSASLEVEQPAVVAHGHWSGESTLRHHGGGPAIPVAIASFLMRDIETGAPFALATVQRDVSASLAAERALRDLAEQRQALLARLVDAQDAERARIAADVHDDPVQALAAVDLRLGLLRRQVAERVPDLTETVDGLLTTVSSATERLRSLLFDLEPPDLHHGLAGALTRAADEIFESTGTRWSVDGAAEPELPDAVRAVGYRIAREAMINVRKHAGADRLEVVVSGQDAGLAVRITDDGLGIGAGRVPASRGHRGISTMQDRAAAAGGHCTVGAAEPTGTTVSLWLPGPSAT